MYSRIVETILSSKPGYKVIAGILENFGEKVCTDLLKKSICSAGMIMIN